MKLFSRTKFFRNIIFVLAFHVAIIASIYFLKNPHKAQVKDFVQVRVVEKESPSQATQPHIAVSRGVLHSEKRDLNRNELLPKAPESLPLVTREEGISGGEKSPVTSFNFEISYPTRAKKLKLEGKVSVHAVLNQESEMVLKVLQSSGFSVLDESVLSALKNDSFREYLVNQKLAERIVHVEFRLNNSPQVASETPLQKIAP